MGEQIDCSVGDEMEDRTNLPFQLVKCYVSFKIPEVCYHFSRYFSGETDAEKHRSTSLDRDTPPLAAENKFPWIVFSVEGYDERIRDRFTFDASGLQNVSVDSEEFSDFDG